MFSSPAQQIPQLLLTDAGWSVAPQVTARDQVAQPALRGTEQLHVLTGEADLLMQLAEQRLLRRFVVLDAALWKLPGVLADAPPPKNVPGIVHQDDADVCSKAFRIDHRDGP
jgi:hypothetical protein